jgi:FkbM family methyltransferase
MIATMKKFTPQVIRRVIRRMWRKIRAFPYRITLTNFVSEGCKFEVTTRVEEGSCVGLFALHAALRGARVVAFEPDPSYRNHLIRNIRINKLQSSIKVVEWAVSDQKDMATLYTDGLGGRSPSLILIGERGSVLANTDSIDNAIADGRLPLPTLVKLDIEGAEILALRGMKQLLSSKAAPRCLFIELHPDFLEGFHSSVDECVTMIESFGYVKEYFRPRAEQLHYIYRKGLSLKGS